MGVPTHQFLGGNQGNALEVEGIALCGDLRLHENVDEQIAELFLKIW